ncbi:MAG: GNAT family N-acetyltransferase [Methylobacterium sp.]|nr:GNAT family N-acetyltransferase [Methylobacterium sp.]MBX9934846.1 GNAT family N-acetyltransferase [Methylobacterium sp.]
MATPIPAKAVLEFTPRPRTLPYPDLPSLLALFNASEVSRAIEPLEQAERIWKETLAQPGLFVFVSEERNSIAATCMLITAPNLLRGGRRHGILDNVVTHPELQGRGHGRTVVQAALGRAWEENCHHVLMQSGRPDSRVHTFYERLGFVPGLRVGYVARRPSS